MFPSTTPRRDTRWRSSFDTFVPFGAYARAQRADYRVNLKMLPDALFGSGYFGFTSL